MRTATIVSATSLMLLGLILIVEAFRNPLTFYSMFDFGVFSLIVGLSVPFASEVEKMVEAEWRTGSPSVPKPIMAVKKDE